MPRSDRSPRPDCGRTFLTFDRNFERISGVDGMTLDV
jgi:hypothetical protein